MLFFKYIKVLVFFYLASWKICRTKLNKVKVLNIDDGITDLKSQEIRLKLVMEDSDSEFLKQESKLFRQSGRHIKPDLGRAKRGFVRELMYKCEHF